MSTFDPNKFKITGSHSGPKTPERKVTPDTKSHKFLKGPIPLPWLIIAAQLPGKTFVVGIVIWFRCGLCKSSTITLPSTVLSLFGVDRNAKRRAIDLLEKASLITVDRRLGKNPIITILETREAR